MFRHRVLTAAIVSLLATAAVASAAELRDGTAVSVRLVGVINSETTKAGEPLRFVVTRNIVSDRGDVLIRRGAAVAGVVTDARRPHWGFRTRKPRLAIAFTLTAARDGQIVLLRASPEHSVERPSIVLDRFERHHQMRWAGGADVFEVYVDGTYQI